MAEYEGREVDLNKPFRLPSGSSKKFGVYVKDGDKVKKVTFGDPNMEIRRDDPDARENFRSRHNCEDKDDKTKPGYWSCRTWEEGTSVNDPLNKSITDPEQRIVYGWATVATINGEPVIDLHGDYIPMSALSDAVNDFMKDVRVANFEHLGFPVGRIIHSLPVSQELAEALGILTDREGWIIGVYVEDDVVWDMVKSGDLPGFSVGGLVNWSQHEEGVEDEAK